MCLQLQLHVYTITSNRPFLNKLGKGDNYPLYPKGEKDTTVKHGLGQNWISNPSLCVVKNKYNVNSNN